MKAGSGSSSPTPFWGLSRRREGLGLAQGQEGVPNWGLRSSGEVAAGAPYYE